MLRRWQKTNSRFLLTALLMALVFSSVFCFNLGFILAQEAEETETEVEVTEEEEVESEETVTTEPEPEIKANEQLIAELNELIDEQREKIDALADKIDTYKDDIKAARNQAASLQNQIYIIENQIAKTNLDIQANQEEIKITELEIEQVNLQIEEKEAIIAKDKEKLAAFIRQLDRYDEKKYLSVLLSNESFSDFFDQIKYLEQIEANLQKTLNRVQENVLALTKDKENLNDKRDRLADLLKKLEQEKYALGDRKETKNYLIAQTQQSEKKFQSLIDDIKQEQVAVNAQVANLERQLRAELEKRGDNEKFNSFGDVAFIHPVGSYPITAYFHDPEYPYRHLFEHSGVDYATPMGTPVKAVETGYVAKVSYGTKWYGNYIMIIHNNSFSTLYAHLNSASVQADQYVARGQVIGYTGNSGFSSGPHLHFEVRLNGIPVNPLSYIP